MAGFVTKAMSIHEYQWKIQYEENKHDQIYQMGLIHAQFQDIVFITI